MGSRSGIHGQTIHYFKHGITRRWILLDNHGRAFDQKSRAELSVWEAIEAVYEGLDKTTYSRETSYTDDLIAQRSRALRTAGWTVVHGAPFKYTD
jgi:hypothetical protein